ncbi:hypothetical protein ACFV1L_10745 [Kitasatospora sp. NPDC059646]|uniref:DUF7691 family protein n=1 Tax=Kitasatospora sp. NPDC059646 TaxID=3346893 RepID=UPI00369DB093
MSSSLHVYLLDVAATRALVGSGDDRFLETLRAEFADRLAEADEYFEDEIADGAPSAYEALRAVVHGGPFTAPEQYVFQYGYAYERLCEFTGRFLPNDSFTPHRGDWLSVVDRGLTDLGVTAVSVTDFAHGAAPAPVPPSCTPGCGSWTPDQVALGLRQFGDTMEAVEAGRIPLPPLGDQSLVDAVFQALGWMKAAAERPGHGVIGFRF